jgi:hypothetical protein
VAVRANVRARLLGVRLLRLEADVVLVPATTFVREPILGPPSTGDGERPAPRQSEARCLLDARRLLAESQDMLDRVRGTV